MLLMVDNYDSFVYNLLHYLQELHEDVSVVRNDALTVDEILADGRYKGIVISPGPCSPNESGICLELVEKAKGVLPIFGVCLGHEAIGQVFGAKVVRAEPVHGKVYDIHHQGQGIFKDLPKPFKATRYHSLVLDPESIPPYLEVTAKTEDNVIMGIQHRDYPIYGVQFHPESIASEYGHEMLKNFLEIAVHDGDH